MNSVDLTVVPSTGNQRNSSWRDMLGIVASIGCAIHCAAMPFVFAYLPALGLSFLADEAFHKWMALICFLIAIAAFLPGLKRHGSWWPVGIGAIGLSIITFAAFGLAGECCPNCDANFIDGNNQVAVAAAGEEHCESCHDCSHDVRPARLAIDGENLQKPRNWLSLLAPWITPLGGLVLVSAHLINHRFGCSCDCCVSEAEAIK